MFLSIKKKICVQAYALSSVQLRTLWQQSRSDAERLRSLRRDWGPDDSDVDSFEDWGEKTSANPRDPWLTKRDSMQASEAMNYTKRTTMGVPFSKCVWS